MPKPLDLALGRWGLTLALLLPWLVSVLQGVTQPLCTLTLPSAEWISSQRLLRLLFVCLLGMGSVREAWLFSLTVF